LGKAADLNNSTAKAMSVPLAFFIAAWTYSLCVNFVPAYRDPADKFTTAKIGIEARSPREEENLDGGAFDVTGIVGSVDVENGSPENAEKV